MGKHNVLLTKTTIHRKSGPPVYFMLFGAIGDLYHNLTFIRPLLYREKANNRILLVYTYDRYGRNAIRDLCQLHGEVDCLYEYDRLRAGKDLPPMEEGARFFRPGIRHPLHEDIITDEYPIEWLRQEAKKEMHLLNGYMGIDKLKKKYKLRRPYAICQLSTTGKDCVADTRLRATARTVSFEFQLVSLFDECDIPGALSIPHPTLYEALSIINHAVIFIGIESSQFMAAAIMGKVSFYQPSGQSLEHFTDDLPLHQHMYKIGRRK